jgi:porin-like protein
MRSFQTLVLGCAVAGLAMNTAQAGELHGKIRPLGQAKSCRAYGTGFQQVPGSDLCIKIGGWVRAQSGAHSGGVNWKALNGTGATAGSASGYITTDVRKPTGYGTVRAYVSVGANHD